MDSYGITGYGVDLGEMQENDPQLKTVLKYLIDNLCELSEEKELVSLNPVIEVPCNNPDFEGLIYFPNCSVVTDTPIKTYTPEEARNEIKHYFEEMLKLFEDNLDDYTEDLSEQEKEQCKLTPEQMERLNSDFANFVNNGAYHLVFTDYC